jgi:hypothetical protein
MHAPRLIQRPVGERAAAPRVFERGSAFPLQVIADTVGAELVHAHDGAIEIDDLRPLNRAGDSHLTFCSSRKYAGQLAATQAAACPHQGAATPVSCQRGRRGHD